MKNPIIKALALALCFFLVSCNRNNFSGSYTFNNTSDDSAAVRINVTFDFNDDGTVLWSDGMSEPVTGHYSVSGNEITATFPGDVRTFTREGDALILNGVRYVRTGQ